MSDTPKPQPRQDRMVKPPEGEVTAYDEPEEEPQSEMSFLEHLEVLRWHLMRSAIAILAITIAAFIFKSIIVDIIILGPTQNDFWTFQWLCKLAAEVGSDALCINDLPTASNVLFNRKLTGQFTLHLQISFIAGFILAFPYVFWEVWRFIKPALYNAEQKTARGTVLIVSFLFFTGIAFGYFLIVPLSYNFFIKYEFTPNITNEIDFVSYTSILTSMVLLCGLMFQLPVVVYYTSRIGLITPEIMRTKRRVATVVIFVMAAIFTPADVMSQFLVAVPLLLLYEVSIFVSRYVSKKYKT